MRIQRYRVSGIGCAPGEAWEEEVDELEIGEDLRVAQ
jgi:hypothetical protein